MGERRKLSQWGLGRDSSTEGIYDKRHQIACPIDLIFRYRRKGGKYHPANEVVMLHIHKITRNRIEEENWGEAATQQNFDWKMNVEMEVMIYV